MNKVFENYLEYLQGEAKRCGAKACTMKTIENNKENEIDVKIFLDFGFDRKAVRRFFAEYCTKFSLCYYSGREKMNLSVDYKSYCR